MHISLSWNGAMGRTSFWTERVYADDYGPCRPRDLNWAPNHAAARQTQCPYYPTVHAARGSSRPKAALVKYAGAALRSGLTGPAVTAVQQALHARVTGRFDTATISALRHFEAVHRVPLSHSMGQTVWRVLLRTTR